MPDPHLARRRLRSQRLAGGSLDSAEAVVGWLLAVQAQDYAGAKWGLGLRMREATDALVEQAFNAGKIIRTHVLRPTWHFALPADLAWLLMLTAPRVHVQNGPRYRALELDPDLLRRGADVMAAAVAGGRFATRSELGEVVEAAGISTAAPQRLAYLLMYAELEGLLCSGPRRGKQFTYALLDERAAPLAMDRNEALVTLMRRFFESRGPATVHDLARWSSLTIKDARLGLEGSRSRLQHETIDGTTYWHGVDNDVDDADAPDAYLLSIYDEYLSGYRDRSAMVKPDHGRRLIGAGNALNYVLVVGSEILGTWKRTFKKGTVHIEIESFERLTPAQRTAVGDAGRRFGAFVGLRAEQRLAQ